MFGLGGSGLVSASALLAGGADVVAYDDDAESVAKANAAGIPTADLRNVDWSRLAALVLAPGVPLTHPVPHWTVQLAQRAGIAVIGDIELFCRERRHVAPDAPFVAITGTNGKSTTTALIAHLATAAGMDAQLGGNIGTAILSLAPPRASSAQPRARPRRRMLVVSDRSRAFARSIGRDPHQSQRGSSRSPRHDGALQSREGAAGRRCAE